MKQAPMPAQAPEAKGQSADPAAGGATQLVADIHSKLIDLMDLVGSSAAADDADKQNLQSIISGFQSFVSDLGAAPGEKKPAPQTPVAKGPMPMETMGKEAMPAGPGY
jgi:hypothetical protein